MKPKNGFTLMELSVVMGIIALIIGSVFVGQTLVRASKIQTALGEYDAYVKAVNEFQNKFLALPGDMTNAQSMWGTDANGCPGSNNSSPQVGTCNGNGDGKIGACDLNGGITSAFEWFRAWQQLSDAGFIANMYSGTPGYGSNFEVKPGLNVPASAINAAGWTILYYTLPTTNAGLWGDQYGHLMVLGGFSAGGLNATPILTTAEALDIDQKIDDGNPGLGIVRTWRTSILPNCTTNDTSQIAQSYAQGNGSYACALIFVMGM